MQDVALPWGGDLSAGPSGDLAVTSGLELSQQRILRRLLTNQADYIWQPTYGAGLGLFIGQPNIARAATGVVYSQIFLEATVAPQPVPTVHVDVISTDEILMSIGYTDVAVNSTQSLTFSLST